MAIKEYPSLTIPSVNGQSGKYLTTNGSQPSWGSASGMTLLGSGTLSGAGLVISSIPDTFNYLFIEVDSPRTGSDAPVGFRANSNSSNYFGFYTRNNNGTIGSAASNTSAWQSTQFLDTAVANDIYISCSIYNYKSTTGFKTACLTAGGPETSGTNYQELVVATWRDVTAITSLQIWANAETFSGGTYSLWGVK